MTNLACKFDDVKLNGKEKQLVQFIDLDKVVHRVYEREINTTISEVDLLAV